MVKVAIVGTGYVGLVTGVALAMAGNSVICVGRNKEKADKINNGHSPFYEPGLNVLLQKFTKSKKLISSINFKESILQSDIIMIAVGTPTVKNKIDLSQIKEVSKQIGTAIKDSHKYHVVVVKSTVVPGTTEQIVKPLIEKYSGKVIGDFGLCMNPEFLREGCAIEDSTKPDRIVIGQYDKKSGEKLVEIYNKFKCEKLFVNIKTAEMIKYASNAFFATVISYSNELSRIAEETKDVDIIDVWKGVHLDRRLSPLINEAKKEKGRIIPGVVSYLYSGCGYGGSCFPKDTKALYNYSKSIGLDVGLLKNVIEINETQPKRILKLLNRSLDNLQDKKITILGLTFKPDTDDLRESPSIKLIKELSKYTSIIRVHDPVAYKFTKERPELRNLPIKLEKDIKSALYDADAVIIMTGWKEYTKLKPTQFIHNHKKSIIIDGRRILSKKEFTKSGITYLGIGLS